MIQNILLVHAWDSVFIFLVCDSVIFVYNSYNNIKFYKLSSFQQCK